MRVAVVGSFREADRQHWGLLEDLDAFRLAARRIGAELMNRGHSLIIGSDGADTADANAVQGAVEVLRANPARDPLPRVLLIRPRGRGPRAFDELRRTMPGIMHERPVDADSWSVVKLVQARYADALILLGGAGMTEQAGLAAAISRKPLACIGSFGGSAAALNNRFMNSPEIWGYRPQELLALPQLQEPFSDVVLRVALEQAWIEGAPKLMIIHGRSPDRDRLKKYLLQHVGRVVVLTDEFAPTQPIPIKFERFASSVDAAIALLTPDDVGGLATDSSGSTPRARENVWVEVGWFWGRRSRAKLLLLRKGNVTIPSDLHGVESYDYVDTPEERHSEIERFITRVRSASEADAVED